MPDGFTKRTGKVIPIDYDVLLTRSEEREPICLSHRERDLLISQLGYARWRGRWENEQFPLSDAEWNIASEWTDNLIARLMRDNECVGRNCTDHSPMSSIITWEPVNPFFEPEEVPAGYALHPWRIVTGSDAGDTLLQLQSGDVMAYSPPIAAGIDFPRFRVTFENVLEVELHLLSYPTGGLVLISEDDDPLTAEVIDLTRDLTSLPPETEPVVIIERKYTDDAEHWIDLTFLPTIADEFPPVLFGGGLRKVVICKPVLPGESECNLDDVRQNTEEPCILEKTADGTTWEEFADITLCLKNSIVTSPGGGLSVVSGGVTTPIGTAPGDSDPRDGVGEPRTGTDDEIKCLASANASNVMWQVVEQGIAEVKKYTALSILVVISLVLSLVFGAPWGILAIPAAPAAAAFVVLASLSTGSYTAKTFREFACILHTNCTVTGGVASFNHAAVKVAVVAKQPTFGFDVWNAIYAFLDVIGADGLNLAGETTAITDPCCDFCTTGTTATYLYLNAEPYAGVLLSKGTNNNNLLSRTATGLRVTANGNTLYARWDWSFIVPPGCEITEFGVYMLNAGEPFYASLLMNSLTTAYKTYSNHRPYGQYHYTGAITPRPGTNTFIMSAYNNNTTTGYFEVQRLYAVYRGCDPFTYYR